MCKELSPKVMRFSAMINPGHIGLKMVARYQAAIAPKTPIYRRLRKSLGEVPAQRLKARVKLAASL